ncbi:MAG TPA: AsmA-like C-terminal region-containing protein [Chitinophagaceae bacterium]|nr:AsmA-like C-terminal region-containing protein [Chitinophagaceae bacterium]
MRRLKKILKITGFTLLFLVALAFAAPFLFKGKIISLVKQEINSSINAKADFKDVSISFFRHFPKVSVALKGLEIVGTGEFEGDTLIAAKEIDASLDIMSMIRGSDYKIYAVAINEPRIHAIVHKNGNANWDIAIEDTATATPDATATPYKLNLQGYTISNGYVLYEDEAGNMSAEIINLDHEGSGDFTADLFTLHTATRAGEITFNYGGIPYLSRVNTSIDADIEVDNKTGKYSFSNGKLLLNQLELDIKGFFQMDADKYNMDISFNAPSTDFKHILSLIPVVYQQDFAKVKTSGKAIFNGFVKGQYSETAMPAYQFNLDVADGFFQYPDLPKAVKNINLQMRVDNPDGITDHTVINIPKAHIEFNNEPFDFRLLVRNPISNLFVDAAAKGRLDLSTVTEFVKLEPGTRINGLLMADLAVNGLVSAIEQQRYDQFNASGNLNLSNFLYASKDYPDGVKLDKLLLSFNPRNVSITELRGQYLKTNFSADGTLNNLLGYALKDQPLDGSLNVKADKLNLNDWMGVPADTTTQSAPAEPFAVPGNIRFVLNSNVDEVVYDKLTINGLSGSLQIADEMVKMNNIRGNALDGTMQINGFYSTRESKKKPDISLAYDVKGLDVQKTFYAFNTVQKLMPAGKFLAGKLSSQLHFTGKLGDNMMPDLNSLTGEGSLLLIEGFLKKFAPLDKLATTLNVKELEAISLKDVKNYIQFTNGKVLVKPFKLKVKDIDMEIGGMHGLDQSLEYLVNLKVPRAMMGEKGNQFVNNLATQVSNKGVPVKISDVVNLNVKIGGTLSNPQLKTDLKQSATNLADDLKQQAQDFAKQKIDSTRTAVKTAVKDTLASAKKQVTDALKDELHKQLSGKKDSTSTSGSSDPKKKLEETGKGLIDNLNPFKKKKQQADTTKKER